MQVDAGLVAALVFALLWLYASWSYRQLAEQEKQTQALLEDLAAAINELSFGQDAKGLQEALKNAKSYTTHQKLRLMIDYVANAPGKEHAPAHDCAKKWVSEGSDLFPQLVAKSRHEKG